MMQSAKRYDLVVAVLSFSVAACTSEPALEAGPELCDGTDDIRLGYLVEGGFVQSAYPFYGAYGHGFFAIDGACRFWAGGDPLVGLRTGTLSAEQARTIAVQTHFAKIRSLASFPDATSCPDASDALLGAGGARINCACGCDTGLPTEISQAFMAAVQFHTILMSSGAASDGPVRAATQPYMSVKGEPPPQNALAWPLAWSPATIAFGPSITPDSGQQIENDADRSALRQLRAGAAQAQHNPDIPVRTADAAFFNLYVRDEPPDLVKQSLAGLRAP